MVAALPQGTNTENATKLLDQLRIFRAVGLALTPIMLWIKCAVAAAVLTMIAMLFVGDVSYKKVFALVTYAQLFLTLNMLAAAVVTLLKGRDAIASPNDLLVSIGWSQFLPFSDPTLKAVVDSLGIFQLWYLVVLAIGLVTILRMSRSMAATAVFIYWALTAIVAAGLATFQSAQGSLPH
jgi:hypothetical protein